MKMEGLVKVKQEDVISAVDNYFKISDAVKEKLQSFKRNNKDKTITLKFLGLIPYKKNLMWHIRDQYHYVAPTGWTLKDVINCYEDNYFIEKELRVGFSLGLIFDNMKTLCEYGHELHFPAEWVELIEEWKTT